MAIYSTYKIEHLINETGAICINGITDNKPTISAQVRLAIPKQLEDACFRTLEKVMFKAPLFIKG